MRGMYECLESPMLKKVPRTEIELGESRKRGGKRHVLNSWFGFTKASIQHEVHLRANRFHNDFVSACPNLQDGTLWLLHPSHYWGSVYVCG